MVRYYQIGGIDIAVQAEELSGEEGNLLPFRTDKPGNPHVFHYERKETLDPPDGSLLHSEPALRVYGGGLQEQRYAGLVKDSWEQAYLRGTHQGKSHSIQLKTSRRSEGICAREILDALALEHLVVQNHGFILHASYILWEGKAILFTAPSGTGKSTQAGLWEQLRGAELINGDRAIVRWTDGNAVACGLPFCGSSQTCKNVTAPLGGIVYLGQSGKTTIQRLTGVQAFRRIWEGCSINTWNREDVVLAADTVQKTAASVPVFYLNCTPDESAVIALEQMLGE